MQARSKSTSALPRLSKLVKSPKLFSNNFSASSMPTDEIESKTNNAAGDALPVESKEFEIEWREEMLEYISNLAEYNSINLAPRSNSSSPSTSVKNPDTSPITSSNTSNTSNASNTPSTSNNAPNNSSNSLKPPEAPDAPAVLVSHDSSSSTNESNGSNGRNGNKKKNLGALPQIVFFFNGHSGGGKAWQFCNELMFNKYDVTLVDMYDLAKKPQLQRQVARLISAHGEYKNSNDSNDSNDSSNANNLEKNEEDGGLIIAICGGDGAMSWGINDLIERCLSHCEVPCVYPRICCVPCGTGNDLSRVLGWGWMQVQRKQSFEYLRDIHFCYKIAQREERLDRWRVTFEFPQERDNLRRLQPDVSDHELDEKIFEQKRSSYDPPLPTSFVSYLSFGFDAMITYTYEQERRSKRNKFTSQNKNKLMLIKHGFSEFFIQSEPINKKIKLYVEGEEVPLISNTRSCKCVNIKSAVGGVDYWGSRKSSKSELQDWTMPQLNDGKIEVCCTRGVHSMMAHGANISHAHRLAQARNVRMEVLETPVALQVDGEAWLIEEPMILTVTFKDQIRFIAGCVNSPLGISNKEFEETLYPKERKFFGKKLKEEVYKDLNPNITLNTQTNNIINNDNNNNNSVGSPKKGETSSDRNGRDRNRNVLSVKNSEAETEHNIDDIDSNESNDSNGASNRNEMNADRSQSPNSKISNVTNKLTSLMTNISLKNLVLKK